MKLLVATGNKGKIKELENFLSGVNIQIKGLSDFENISQVRETGKTFAENSALKAKSYAAQTGLWALADDSGLEVDYLNGAPGVFSARFAGENATDQENIEKLLAELSEITKEKNRRARFVCLMTIADEKGEVKFNARGVCEGRIAVNPSGTNGFGYDPVFIPEGFEQTFGELSADFKKKLSHRAQAMEKIIEYLSRFTAS